MSEIMCQTPDQSAPLSQINISTTTSSNGLYKYQLGKPFTITVEASLSPMATQPITVLVLDTPLDEYDTSWFERNLILTNTETSEAHVTLPKYEPPPAYESPQETNGINVPVRHDYQCCFLTLYPGKPYWAVHTLSADLISSSNIGVDIARYRTSLVGAYNLEIGSHYEITLQDAARWIKWYRVGEKNQVLSQPHSVSDLLRYLTGQPQHVERVNDSKMPPIRLMLQNAECVTVKKTKELTQITHMEDNRYLFQVESEPDFYITWGNIDPFVWNPLLVEESDPDSDGSHIYMCG